MGPLTNPSRKRASKHAVKQMLNQLTSDYGTGKGPAKRKKDDDPRWTKLLSMSGGKSRKQRRQEERKLKKAKLNAFHQKQLLSSVRVEELSVSPKNISKDKNKKEKKKQKQLKKKQQKQKKNEDQEELRKQRLLEANKFEEKTIKKLEKDLHFHKNKKTKKKIVPSIFKADGLDYLLDVVDPAKLEDLEDEEGGLGAEGEDEDSLGLLDALGSEDDEEEEEEDEEEGAEQRLIGSKMVLDKRKHLESNDEEEGGDRISRKKSQKGSTEKINNEDDVSDQGDDYDDDFLQAEELEEEEEDGLSEEEENEDSGEDGDTKIRDLSRTSAREKVGTNVKSKRKHSDTESDDEEEEEEEEEEDVSEDEISDDGNSIQSEGTESRTTIQKSPPKMDPYGNIIGEEQPARTGAYVPPQKRAKMMGEDSKKKEQLERLRKQLKGLINRLSDSNIKPISGQVEELYLNYSRNDMNETLTDLILQACVGPSLTPDRLIMEQMLLIAVLHTNVGNEVGAHFIQLLTVKFDNLYKELDGQVEDKQCDNIILLFTHLYNLKVIHCTLIYDLIRLLVDGFSEKDIELLLLLLRNCGMMLRKDDPSSLKDIILQIQTKANTCSDEFKEQSRVKFMLETIFAIRNNNLRKIPNFDPSHLEHLRKLLRILVRDRGHSDSDGTLRISYKDLLSAEDKGRWWIVGSAWVGSQHSDSSDVTTATILGDKPSNKISELSRKQRMNTDIRRTIFGIIMTAEDYMDAFEKCLRLGLKGGREREIVHVLLDCCMQEKVFNPYYAYLATKFCQFDRKFKMAFQFSLWDKFKMLEDMSKENASNLAHLIVHLLAAKALPISILKVIEFADIDKATVKFLRILLLGILQHPEDTLKSILDIVVGNAKLKMLCDGLRLFLHHFILKALNKATLGLSQEMQGVIRDKVKFADDVLKGEDIVL